MQKKYFIKIFGRVQGVGFRWSSYEQFVDLGLVGKAENGKDGTVEITVSGEDYQLDKFVEWCRKGPLGNRVTNVEISEMPIEENSNLKEEKKDEQE